MSKELNEAQKRLMPLIDKATQRKADAHLAYQKALDGLRYAECALRQSESAYCTIIEAFDAVGGKP